MEFARQQAAAASKAQADAAKKAEMAANWPLIADTLFKAAFDALDRSPDDASRAALLRRVNTGSYDRLAVDPAAGKKPALTGRNEGQRLI